MNQRPSLPLKFTTLRRFDVRFGPGVVVAVFFEPTDTASDQEPDANAQQKSGQRKAEGFRSV